MLIKAKNWTCAPEHKQPIMLFVQRARELLLHTSSIIRKPEVASVFLIVRELDFLIKEQKDKFHKSAEKHIALLLDELEKSLKKDEVAKYLIGDRYEYIVNILKSDAVPNARIDAIQLLGSRIARIDYLLISKNRIVDIINGGGKEKRRLVNLTDCTIYAILDAGYPAQTVYHLLNITFLNKDDAVHMTGSETFEKFFSYFDLRRHDYHVIFGIKDESGNSSSHIPNVIYSAYQKGSPEYDDLINRLPGKSKNFFKVDELKSILVAKLKAIDPQSARSIAENQISFLTSMLQLKRHKVKISIQNEAVVYREGKNEYVHTNRPKEPVLRTPHDSELAIDDLAKFLNRLSAVDENSVSRYTRAVQLHSSALSSSQVEIQLLNLWIAFETLFITDTVENLSKIISCAEPFIFNAFAVYDVAEMHEYIIRHHSASWEEACLTSSALSEFSGATRLLAMMALPDFDDATKLFLSKLDGDPLLKFRLWEKSEFSRKARRLEEWFGSVLRIIKFDFHRIYRARNQIVHIGYSPADLSEIVQRTHHYLDIVLTMIEMLLAKPGGAFSIEQAVMEAEMVRQGVFDLVKTEAKKDSVCVLGNFVAIHWGRPLLA